MDNITLNELSAKLKIAPLNIIREEAEMLVLRVISEGPFLKDIVFYGGTALRLAYNCPRFSEDLDFLMIHPVKEADLKAVLLEAVRLESTLSLAEIKDKRNTLFAMLKLRSPSLKHPLSIKIEISKKKNGIEKEFKPLVSPCSPLQPVLFTATLASMEKAKIRALKRRNAPRDWFDLYYIFSLLRQPFEPGVKLKYDPAEYKREMRRFLPRDKWPLINESIKNHAG